MRKQCYVIVQLKQKLAYVMKLRHRLMIHRINTLETSQSDYILKI